MALARALGVAAHEVGLCIMVCEEGWVWRLVARLATTHTPRIYTLTLPHGCSAFGPIQRGAAGMQATAAASWPFTVRHVRYCTVHTERYAGQSSIKFVRLQRSSQWPVPLFTPQLHRYAPSTRSHAVVVANSCKPL